MNRLTTDHPKNNFETLTNLVYGKGGWQYIRHGETEMIRLCAHVWVYDGLCKDDGKAYFTYRCLKCGMYREAESIERK